DTGYLNYTNWSMRVIGDIVLASGLSSFDRNKFLCLISEEKDEYILEDSLWPTWVCTAFKQVIEMIFGNQNMQEPILITQGFIRCVVLLKMSPGRMTKCFMENINFWLGLITTKLGVECSEIEDITSNDPVDEEKNAKLR